MTSDSVWKAFSGRLFDQNQFAIKLGLDNMRRAFALEGDPQQSAPAIVVGGTNGKGSVCSAVAAILQAHGLRVGLYTSPHLIELRERFRIDGVPATREDVLDVGRHVLKRYAEPGSEPCLTFFELTTLMAALLFARAKVDVVVWEVGLGGRLDAVNVVEPDLTVITNIDLDHQKYLGDTIAQVATEKAGLRRESVPLVLGPQTHDAARVVFDRPVVVHVPLPADPGHASIDWDHGSVDNRSARENLATAREAARQFLGARWDAAREREGLERRRWPGRLDPRVVVRDDGQRLRFLLDAAHNPAGCERLYEVFEREPPACAIIGAMQDKDIEGMFAVLNRLKVPTLIADIDSKRAADSARIAEALSTTVLARGPAPELFARASADGYTAVFGSIYLLGEWFAWAETAVEELVTWRRLP